MARLFPDLTDEQVDKAAIEHAGLDDLDMRKVEAHIALAVGNGRLSPQPDQPVEFLKRFRCVVEVGGTLRPTISGLLMFSSDPQAFLPHAVVGLGHFSGVGIEQGEAIHLGRCSGTLHEQIDAAFKYLWTNIRHGFSLEDSPRRVERPEYPRVALRELTVNAIAHRDYNNDGHYSRITMFGDHIEWVSPGGLAGDVTVENIIQSQYNRNPTIAELLYQGGYIERFGLGLDMVARELEKAELPPLRMRDTGGAFSVTMYGSDAPGSRAQSPFRQLLLEHARQHRQLTMDDVRKLNDEQREYRSERSLRYDLRSLVEAGFLRRVGQSRDTAYVPVEDNNALSG